MKRIAWLTVLIAFMALIFARDLLPQVDEKLFPCSVSLRQQVFVETIKNPVIVDEALVGGQTVKCEIDTVDLGSGTMISRSGLILTNYHVWQFTPKLRYDKANNLAYQVKASTVDVLVYVLDPTNIFKEPKKKYVARFLSGSEDQDLVVMKCVLDANTGQEIRGVDLPYMKISNPFGIPMGAGIGILGYPGIGGKTITMTGGRFLGYVGDDDCTIKTDAGISFGNSGGSAVYQDGLFGVPTAMSGVQAGTNFGYIVPVTRALGPLLEAKLHYGEDIPPVDRKWIASPLNSDLSKASTYVAGRVVSAQTNAGVQLARVWIFRRDRTADQIESLYEEIQKISSIVTIQQRSRAGQTVEDIAKSMQLTEEDVQAAMKTDVLEGASHDAKAFLQGEFFYTVLDAGFDGFFFTSERPVPRNAQLVLAVSREGYRRVEKQFATTDDEVLDLGTIKSYPY